MHPITAKITDLHRQLLWRERAVATCATLAVVLAAAIALGFADYWLQFRDRGLRMMATAALVAATGWAVYRWWYVPRRGRERPLAVARRVESHFPQLQDRLASALEFLTQSEEDLTAGSATLRRAVVNQAELELSELPIDAIVDRRPLQRAGIAATIAVAAVTGCLILNAEAVRTALMRLAAPWGDTAWPRSNHLAFRAPPTRLAVGQAFEVELYDRGGALPDDVRIEYRAEHKGRREVQSEWMNRVGEVMVGRRENVRESFAFRAVGGDDDTMPWTAVEVVEPPQLVELSMMVHPPAYTGIRATVLQPPLKVLAGSAIEVIGMADEPLSGARVATGTTTIDATTDDKEFAVVERQWIASESGTFRLELANLDGVWGTADEWRLRVEPDPAPTVAWQQPSANVFVLPTGNVPIAALVKDNLAIASVDLRYTRSDKPDAEPSTIGMHSGPERAVADPNQLGDSRVVGYNWSLASLALPVGTQLTVDIVADDYRPGSGKTVAPRQITIIDREELAARLADQQAQIAQRLDEAAALQRTARRTVRDLEIQLRDAGQLAPRDRDTLQAGEFNQRRVRQMLTDPAEGIAQLADALVVELKMNGVADKELQQRMENLERKLGDLANGPLGAADQALTAARKSAENGDGTLAEPLASAGSQQDRSIAVLERLLNELTGWADYERLVRDLAELREDQLAHRSNTRNAIGVDALPLELGELSRQQRATLNRAAAAQEGLADRCERIEQGLDTLATNTDQDSDAAVLLADAVALVRQLAIVGQMREARRDLESNRVGQALARETVIADALEQVLDLLRNRAESNPAQLVEKLRAAERQLAALRAALHELRQAIAQIERQPETGSNGQQQRELHERQRQLRSQIDRLARDLERLQAPAAGRSAEQAGEKLSDSPTGEQQPADGETVEQAEQDLADAAEQLAKKRQQAEEDWARAFLERFKVELAAMMSQQRAVIDDTAALDGERSNDGQLTEMQQAAVETLATRERQLAEDARVHRELLSGLRVIAVALDAAEKHLTMAAEQLDRQAVGTPTQQAEQMALSRFEQITEALEEAAAAANNPPPPGGQGNAGAEGQSKRPLFDLFEVKLLRSLQADLNQRTEAFQSQLQQEDPTAREGEAEQLAAEQGQLAELVEELLSRDN